MSTTELDITIKFQLFHHRKSGDFTQSKKHKSKERKKSRQEFSFNGHQVCKGTFAFANGVNRKKNDAIGRSLDAEGLSPRTLGNKGKSPKHALKLSDVESVKRFLQSYGNQYGLPLPGRMPNQKSHAILLPSDKTKADIHEEYLEACESMNMRKICLSKSKDIWLEQTPHVVIIKPATVLCHTCQAYENSITHS
ncbi:unnamed protein product [Mytilus coruscus]|uniref:Uncharacterized protein n=1 Tax=Mytilus coruscus TaxID=42192 RepID=A0A6J8DDF3_MYTCO|nr:unnamed protein product [Mytilus coruscus]